MVEDVHFPGLEPFKIDKVADVLLLFLIEDDVPGSEVFDQLFLHLFLSKYVEYLPKTAKVKVFISHFQPFVDPKTVFLP